MTIHYRHVSDKRRALAAIEDAVSDLPDARTIGGTQALTLLPPGGPDKGVALQQARRLFHCDKALYIGDDDTDEDAFSSLPGRPAAVDSRRRQAEVCGGVPTHAAVGHRSPAPGSARGEGQDRHAARAPRRARARKIL